MDVIHWWLGWPTWLQDISIVILVLAILSPRAVYSRTIIKKSN